MDSRHSDKIAIVTDRHTDIRHSTANSFAKRLCRVVIAAYRNALKKGDTTLRAWTVTRVLEKSSDATHQESVDRWPPEAFAAYACSCCAVVSVMTRQQAGGSKAVDGGTTQGGYL